MINELFRKMTVAQIFLLCQELYQDADPAAHIGIRMIMKKVKDANYVNSFGLNNLTLII